MKTFKLVSIIGVTLVLVIGAFTGCESTGGGSTQVSTATYYGVGFYDPWYYGHYDYDHDVIVTPPGPGAPPDQGLRPSHPIAEPPAGSPVQPSHPIAQPPAVSAQPPVASQRPAARPMPSIPTTPRAAPRAGGRRR